ncbi:DUF6894 family protein [Glacieibacterium frigidum]|uniref:DUF6894 domain-containing protein n=1 Tax=Glacieibacterium frigidum TaxID=2593303 RepID=A0A552U9Q4_9SPHN|nr:hypothetical protein [Glacieibacterium frigidum]TRW14951.1 hypothetical protein FMM06_14925 [Glacieibacterium frigidum]
MKCFFNLAGAIYNPDVEGVEIATINEARLEAARFLSGVISDHPDAVWAGDEVRVEVTDANQLVLFTIVAFGIDAAAVAGQPASFRSSAETFSRKKRRA